MLISDLREIFIALLAGLAQGVLEWLPISSKTVLLMIFLSYGLSPSSSYALGLLLNGVTAAAAIIYFMDEIRGMLSQVRKPLASSEEASLLRFLLISTGITGVVAAPLAGLSLRILEAFGNLSLLMIGSLLALTALMAWIRERRGRYGGRESPRSVDALIAGLAQGLSALPGISRSGVTILALLLLGYSPSASLKLSFLMSIPVTIGGSAFAYLIAPSIPVGIGFAGIILSSIIALISSIFVISTMLRISQRVRASIFALILSSMALAAYILMT